jgi:hypothetical protein
MRYLETDPPPGRAKLVGADVSHVSGVIYTEGATASLEVRVDVAVV